VRKLLLICAALATMAVPASAADMLVKKAPPRAPLPVWSWTGFYIGGHIGGAWAKSDWFEDPNQNGDNALAPVGFQNASISSAGFIGGGQVGFDYQNGWAVFGVQADVDLADIKATQGVCFLPFVAATNLPVSCTAHLHSVGTVTGRVGAAVDRTLLYVLGGFAWAHEQLNLTCTGCTAIGSSDPFNSATTRDGWTIGAGLEYAFASNWSAFLQYNYMGFGTRDLVFVGNPASIGLVNQDVRDHINVIKAGINYRFH